MPPRSNLEQVLSELGRYDWKRFTKALKTLPANVDPKLAAAAVLSFIREPHPSFKSLGHRCQELPAPVIREVLGQLHADTRPHAYVLREAVPQDACLDWPRGQAP